MNTLNCSTNGLSIQYEQGNLTNGTGSVYYYGGTNGTLWQFWQNEYYPHVIKESYPIYIQEKAMDKGKLAFELLKALMDKGFVKVDKVKDFVEAMDTILKTL